jgi:hypothetical protein
MSTLLDVGRLCGAMLVLAGVAGCATSSTTTPRTRLSDDFSFYEPFDNSNDAGPNYLVGPPAPPRNEPSQRFPSGASPSFPSIPNESLPRSCLSCD